MQAHTWTYLLQRVNWRYGVLFGIVVIVVVGVALHDPIPQDPRYHSFADRRTLLGIPNFWNVISNLPFLIAGTVGLAHARRLKSPGSMRLSHALFFTGVLLVSFGSGYYHLHPNNSTLAWDRLPMAIAFMAFFSIVLSEFIDADAGRRLLPLLVASGVSSIVYWRNVDDLRPYVVVQFLPLALIPFLLLLFPSSSSRMAPVWAMLVAYASAKIAEVLDEPIFTVTGGISGHTLKHVLAAMGACFVCLLARRREFIEGPQKNPMSRS